MTNQTYSTRDVGVNAQPLGRVARMHAELPLPVLERGTAWGNKTSPCDTPIHSGNLPAKGKSCTSAFTVASDDFLPMRRFTSNTVFTGFDDACKQYKNQARGCRSGTTAAGCRCSRAGYCSQHAVWFGVVSAFVDQDIGSLVCCCTSTEGLAVNSC